MSTVEVACTLYVREEISTVEKACTLYVLDEISTVEKACTLYVREEISTVEKACTLYVLDEKVKEEFSEFQGSIYWIYILVVFVCLSDNDP